MIIHNQSTMSLYKKIKDTFNPPPSLKGEDWLVPSDDLFDSIESSIQNDLKKKSEIPVVYIQLLFDLSRNFAIANRALLACALPARVSGGGGGGGGIGSGKEVCVVTVASSPVDG